MRAALHLSPILLSAALLAAAGPVAAQTAAPAEAAAPASVPDKPYEPSVGQAGKDVVWVPTPQALVDKMLDMAGATPADVLLDLGSGDGRTVITAARRGIRATGIEYDERMVVLSQRNAERDGVTDRARFVKQDLFETDLSGASVITMFLLTDINLKLRPKLLALKPGTRIVSNTFKMGDWEPDEVHTVDRNAGCNGAYCTAYLWIVPAQAAGTHRLPQGELTLVQNYQRLSGTLNAGGKVVPVHGRMVGEQLSLDAGGRSLRGRVDGGRLELR